MQNSRPLDVLQLQSDEKGGCVKLEVNSDLDINHLTHLSLSRFMSFLKSPNRQRARSFSSPAPLPIHLQVLLRLSLLVHCLPVLLLSLTFHILCPPTVTLEGSRLCNS